MEEDDPFGSIAELCQVSSSQESLLRSCRFFGQAEASASSSSEEDGDYNDPAYIPVDSTGITMVSPPESVENEITQLEDLFHTPPEGSPSANHCADHRTVDGGRSRDGDTVPIDADSLANMTAVDLGRDTDLCFSEEVELTQRMEIDSDQNIAFQGEPDEARVSMSELSPAQQLLGESPWKRMKISSFESPIVRLATVQEKPKEKSSKSFEKLKSMSVSPSPIDLSGTSGKNRDSSDTLELEDQQNNVSNSEVGEDIYAIREELLKSSEVSKSKSVSPALRGLEFSTEVIDSEIEERNIESCIKGISDGKKMDMEDVDKFRFSGGNYSKLLEMERKAKGKRVLPSRIYATVGAAASSKTATQGAAGSTSSNTAHKDTAAASTSVKIGAEGTAAASTSAKLGAKGIAGNVSESDILPEKKSTKNFLLDVLKVLAKDDDKCNENLKHLSLMEVVKRRGVPFAQHSKDDDMCNENLKHLSLMEVVKRHGTVFTQPSWWPKEGLEVKK